MRFWIDIENASHQRVGDGPIDTATRCTTRQRVSRVGEFSFEMPATDGRASLVTARRTAAIYGMVGGEKTYFGGGAIDKIVTRIGGGGVPMLQVSGSDLLTELSRISVGKLDLADTGDANIAALLSQVSSPPLSWAVSREVGSPEFRARLVYESVFNSLFAIAEKTGAFFRFDSSSLPTRGLEWFYTITDSGVLATMHGDPVALEGNTDVCLITDITVDQDSNDLKTRAFLFGSGEGDSITRAVYAVSWPNGSSTAGSYSVDDATFTYNYATNTLVNTAAEALYGRDELALAFKDIAPLSNTLVDMTAASDYLLVAGIQYLFNNRKPFQSYRLAVAGLRRTLKPGQSILVQARRYRDGEKPIDINQRLFILEVQNTVDTDGIYTSGLTVASMNRWPVNDNETIAREMAKTTVMSAHPQTGPNVDTISYREHLDDTHNATLHFWLGEETTTVQSVLVRFRVDPLRSTVTSIAGGSTTTPSGGAGTSDVTGAAVMNHSHDVEVSGLSAVAGAPVYFNTTNGLHTNSGAGLQSGPGTILRNLQSHQHGTPAHAHTFTPVINSSYGVFDDSGANTYLATDLEWKTAADGAWTAIAGGDAISGASGWYGIDITARIATTQRPTTAINDVQFRVKTASKVGKKAQLTVQIERRTSIQSIAVY